MAKGAEIKEGDNRGEGMADADQAEKNGGAGEKKRGGPRLWPHRAEGMQGL